LGEENVFIRLTAHSHPILAIMKKIDIFTETSLSPRGVQGNTARNMTVGGTVASDETQGLTLKIS
jgi:hypothetical protein